MFWINVCFGYFVCWDQMNLIRIDSYIFSWSMQLIMIFQSLRKFFFRYYRSSAVCVCVCMWACMYAFTITATPFNLDLSNFGITLHMWISKITFLKFLKNCFYAELSPFFYISLRFLFNLKSNYAKTRGDRNTFVFCT